MKELNAKELITISAGGPVWRWFGKLAASIVNSYDRNNGKIYSDAMNGIYTAD